MAVKLNTRVLHVAWEAILVCKCCFHSVAPVKKDIITSQFGTILSVIRSSSMFSGDTNKTLWKYLVILAAKHIIGSPPKNIWINKSWRLSKQILSSTEPPAATAPLQFSKTILVIDNKPKLITKGSFCSSHVNCVRSTATIIEIIMQWRNLTHSLETNSTKAYQPRKSQFYVMFWL